MNSTDDVAVSDTLSIHETRTDESGSVKVESLIEGAAYISGMLVHSAELSGVLTAIKHFAPNKNSVLIQGESGTGKELVARALHKDGPAPNGPFVIFNCSNLMDTLAEAQLFGHVKGAFTDAREDSIGYFRSAHGGTLFLDEIGELPLNLQPKLLRAVEAHEIQSVGSAQTHKIDIKLISATNCDLLAMVKVGTFRADLYYRIDAAAILLPPLRDRQNAIPAFVGHFIRQNNRLFGKKIRSISQNALDVICDYSWPGNIRELGHAIESAMLMADGDEIDVQHLPLFGMAHSDESLQPSSTIAEENVTEASPGNKEEAKDFSLKSAVGDAAKEVLLKALRAVGGDCIRTARLLGVSRYTVYRMMARHRLGHARDYQLPKSTTSSAWPDRRPYDDDRK
jgi:transcriptional regulator with GAF, ATPase, and Fis domain